MKNKLCKFVAFALAAVSSVSLVACNKTPSGGETVDTNKTQLYVYNYNGGYGSEWIMEAKTRFEKLHENDEYESGKKGVQVVLDPSKSNIDTKINGDNEVYFAESAYYYTLKNQNQLADITSAVTTPLDGETKSIEDKMSASQKNFFNAGGKYYAVPHVNTFVGMTYNKDVFDAKNFYFAAEPYTENGKVTALEDWFIADKNDAKSVGPDGKPNTDDDGLPSTYDEFFILLEYMEENNVQSITWNGKRFYHYLTWLMQQLIADYEGLDQMMLNFTMDGTANDLGKIVDGNFVLDEETTKIDETNKNELARQSGKYYALKFIERLYKISVDDKGNPNDIVGKKAVYSSDYEHTTAQEDFAYGSRDGYSKDIGILVEGIWWENEAAPSFKKIVDRTNDESMAAKNRQFRFMPLPNANAEITAQKGKDEKKSVLYDQLFSLACVKAGLSAEKQKLAEEFIRFCNTDAELRAFTVKTNTVKALEYTLEDSDKEQMTPFGRSVWEAKQNSEIVYPYATNSTYMNNMKHFSGFEMYCARYGYENSATTDTYAIQAFIKGKTAEEYFEGLKIYLDKYNWN